MFCKRQGSIIKKKERKKERKIINAFKALQI
jgi:hypothetical protein